jgi:rhodanese-related sulfurtransferase
MSRFLREAAVLLATALLAAAISNAVAEPERKLKWVGKYDEAGVAPGASAVPTSAAGAAVGAAPAPDSGKTFPPHPGTPWVEISGDDVAALHARNTLFLDARRTSVHHDGHIAGARPFSVWEADVDDKVKALFAEGLDQSAPVVIYCSGGDCEDSHMLGQKLYMAGFDNVLVYKDGFPDWEKRGLPVTKGAEP